MKRKIRIIAMLLAFVMVAAIWPMPVNAQDSNTSEHTLTADDLLGSEFFEPMTREKYISELASTEGITYVEAEAKVDADMEAALASLPAPLSWEQDSTVDKGSGVYWNYGRVISTFTHATGLTVSFSVQAIMLRTQYGTNWVSCSSTGTYYPGSGNFTFHGGVTASLISTTQLRMVLDGYIQIKRTIANSLGLNIAEFSGSTTISGEQYLRDEAYKAHTEVSPQRG